MVGARRITSPQACTAYNGEPRAGLPNLLGFKLLGIPWEVGRNL